MADRSITISLEARVSGLVAGMRTAQQATRDTGSRLAAFAREHEQSMDRVGKAGMLMGGGLLAGVGVAVKSFMEFDKAMSEVNASTHETAGNMEMLRQAAIDAGADTAFSAAEAARGIDELAKAGVKTSDILGGGLKGALSLAAAGGLGVGEAAEISASALTQFGLRGDKVSHIADLLAAGAGKAQGSVQDMGMALNQAGLVANMTGLSIEETTGGLASFAAAGLTGSDAGTSFKSMLQRLTPQSKEAEQAMAGLGLSAYDSQGNFKGLEAFAGNLKDSMKDLTPEARNAAMGVIFGSDAVRAANVLYENGAEGIAKWTAAVNDTGFAAETAALKQDNLAGDFEKLTGSLDSVFLKSASGANGALRGLVQGAEDFVDSIGEIPGPVLQAGLGMAGITGAALLVGGAFTSTLPRIMEGVGAFRELERAAPRAARALKGAGLVAGMFAVAGALGAIDTAITDSQIERSVGRTTSALIELSKQSGNIQQSSVLLDDLFQKKDGSALISGVTDLDSAMDRMFKKDWQQSFSDWGESMLKPIANMMGVKGAAQELDESFSTIDEQLASFVQSGNADLAAKAFKQLEDRAAAKGINPEEFKAKFGAYSEALKQADADAKVAAEGIEKVTTATGQVVPITPEVAKALEDIGVSAQGAVTNLVKFTDALVNAGLMQLSARDAARGYQAAIDAVSAAITSNGTTLDITTEKGRANQAALDGVASAGLKLVQANAAAGASQTSLQGNLNETYNRLIASAGQFGITGAAADSLARKVLGVPPGVSIKSWMSDAAKRMAEATAGAINGIPSEKNVTVNTTYNETTIQRVIRQLSGDAAPVGAGTVLAPKKKAVGGAIIGPGTGTSDDIPAWLSNGEHVLTADEVRKMGGQAAVYRFRQMLDMGKLPKFASGGAVTWGQVTPAKWKSLIAQGWKGRAGDKQETLYPPNYSGTELGHLGESANARANRLYRESQTAAKKRAAELKKSAQYRSEQMADLALDDSRGQSYRTVNDSLSSAYSFSDRLRSVAKSGNVPSQKWMLLDKANSSDNALRSLYSQSERLGKSLESAKKRYEDLKQVRDSVAAKLSGEFSIGEAAKRGSVYGKDSMKSIQGAASRFLAKVQGFAGKLKGLQKLGYSASIIQEIADMGVADGSLAADALLKAKPAEVKKLNDTYKAIGTASTLAGTYVTDAMYKGGVNAAAGLVKGLESQQGAIDKQMERIGLSMESALKKALGFPAPKKKAVGGRVYGPGTTTSDSVPHMLSKDEYVIKASAAKRIGYDELDRMNRGQMKPAITYRPVSSAGSGSVSRDVHVHVDAKPGLAHEYASDMARKSTVRLKDALHSIDIR